MKALLLLTALAGSVIAQIPCAPQYITTTCYTAFLPFPGLGAGNLGNVGYCYPCYYQYCVDSCPSGSMSPPYCSQGVAACSSVSRVIESDTTCTGVDLFTCPETAPYACFVHFYFSDMCNAGVDCGDFNVGPICTVSPVSENRRRNSHAQTVLAFVRYRHRQYPG